VTQPSAPLASGELGSGAGSNRSAHLWLSLKRWYQREADREWLRGLAVLFVLAVAAHFYLAPASSLMWARDRAHLMSDGGDATTLPFIYHVILQQAHDSLRNLLYGSIYNPQLGPPFGSGMWVPWLERWLVVLFGTVLPVETLPTAFVWVLMVLAGMCFYAFARLENWPTLLAASFAFAYAFNPYTRARASVHDALVGIYCMPLMFVALSYLKREATPRRIAVSSLLFILSLWTAHYYILILVAIAPLFLWFQIRSDEVPANAALSQRFAGWRRIGPLALAALPAVAFLAWNYLYPLAPGTPATHAAVASQDAGEVFMHVYAARPIDYLSNDVAFGPRDLNPLRRRINEQVASDLDGSNPPERSNGIRWSVVFPFLALLLAMCVPALRERLRRSLGQASWRKFTYWTIFALLMFWFSLSPRSVSVYHRDLGISSWVRFLFHEYRVPSRFGPFVHFAVLAAVGTCASVLWRRHFGPSAASWRRSLTGVVPMLMVVEYLPLYAIPVAPTFPPRHDLVAAGGGTCGVGMYFPYSQGAGSGEEVEMYRIYQQLRDTDCRTLQQPLRTELHGRLWSRLGSKPFSKAIKSPARSRTLQRRFVSFAKCANLEWVIFRERVPESWRSRICDQLGWERVSEDACSAPPPRAASFADPMSTCMPVLGGTQQ
jgi:hypothetical protein